MNPDRTPAGDAFATLAISVLRLAGHLQTAGDALARPVGQTSARWQVLAAADHAPMSVADAGRALGMTRQGVQRVADLLEKDGLIAYAENPAHQRAKLMVLTDAGKAALGAIRARQAVWANALGEVVGENDIRQATETVIAALQAVEKLPISER
ncbi:MarR family winged helix-turn-helix transcriptional regulator [Shinella zoogloeoides]|jgi:DNA-binding MarR family transcriptional regulator|uniref:MarR family winged helix-turn-helix transcriptional regulator n=1 Tax=Shinella zoogloeoides TaxID=352475 RepID=UPI00273ED40C|nr:MarR family winged helix-turn-helix transcriptional regulator [Shinella zoogloeoides]WLR91797.1 MarR family winged helix-turn-helix transcriptional regulator [Shinella zoogloeoides]